MENAVEDGFTKEKIEALNLAMASGNPQEVEAAKYSLLVDATSLLGLVVNYITLERNGITFDFGANIIPKGTRLYRIRSFHDDVDYSDPAAWRPPPHQSQGRANREKQEALYLGSTETVCLLETHTLQHQKCMLGTYECSEDIVVSGFLRDSDTNWLHNLAGIVLNAFLIAPSRCERNNELFEFLDKQYGKLTLDDLSDISCAVERGGLELPLKFGVLNQRTELHEITNQLCEILASKTSCGIRYSSCYMPLEAPGIICTDFNLVLYREGFEKLSVIDCEARTIKSPITPTSVIECLLA